MTHLTYEECVALKDAGFPQDEESKRRRWLPTGEIVYGTQHFAPTRCLGDINSDELLAAIAGRFGAAAGPLHTIQLLRRDLPSRWEARWTIPSHEVYGYAETPVSALCALYIALAKEATE